MDLGFNKIAFCVLATGLMLIGLSEASHGFFPSEGGHAEGANQHAAADKVCPASGKVAGYCVDVPIVETGPVEAVDTGPRDYNVLLTAANIEAGKGQAAKCLQCHSLEPNGETITGPPLYGIVGHLIASHAAFKYSAGDTGLAGKSGQTWDYEHLDHFLENPKKYAPGTAMNFLGVRKVKDRMDLIAYLRTLTAGELLALPPPLPPQAAPAEGATPAAAEGAAPATPGPEGAAPAGTPATPPAQPAPAPAQH